jgi:dethiobiotin synthetase
LRGFFITGTDTGVGKTVAGCAIASALRSADETVRVMKPVETGVGPAGPLDAIALSSAAGNPDPLSDVCPQRFEMPAAPNVAARAEGREVELGQVRSAWDRISGRGGISVVEAAGGLLAPLTDDLTMADLGRELALPFIVVARGALGTINHTLLTLAEIERQALPLAGVIVSIGAAALSQADAANLAFLRRTLGSRLLAEIPPAAENPATHPALNPGKWLLDT